MGDLIITSPAFGQNENIPVKYTCDGNDFNPPLIIDGVPDKAKSLALIMDDPDAPSGTFVHWVVWNIDPKTKEIRENAAPKGAQQGTTDFRRRGYGGPCPPSGSHRYFFKLYALDASLAVGTGAKKTDLEKAMKGHVLSEGQLVGVYKRK